MEYTTKRIKDVLCAVFFASTLLFPFVAESATCGICNDSYLSCISSGGSSSSCGRQLQSCQSACYGGDTKSSEGGGGFGTLILVVAIGSAAFFFVNSWMNQKKEAREIEEEKERRLKMTPEEIAQEQEEIARKKQIAETIDLREELLSKLQNMTVDEITEYTKSNRRATTAWLFRHGYTCKDYDGEKKRSEYFARSESEKQKS